MKLSSNWSDYEIIASGNGEKLERWGSYILRRPDPQAVWPAEKGAGGWLNADAIYHRSASGGGNWEFLRKLPQSWEIAYRNLRFNITPMQFKHTGIFPEQAVNWDWMAGKLRGGDGAGSGGSASGGDGIGGGGSEQACGDGIGGGGSEQACGGGGGVSGGARVLNLFAYTGAATVAAASAGARVCHVDAARGMVAKAKENAALSGIAADRLRYIVDDVFKFTRREIRRGARYDAVVMDPPAYGRGPDGELWKAETHLYEIVELCAALLSETPLFFIVNSYSTGISAAAIENVLKIAVGGRFCGRTESGELGLPVTRGRFVLPCGCCARWERIAQ